MPSSTTSNTDNIGWTIADVIAKELVTAKEAHWKKFDKRAAKFEKKMSLKMQQYFSDQKTWLINKLQEKSKDFPGEMSLKMQQVFKAISDAEQAVWDAWDEELQELMEPLYNEIIFETGNAIAAEIGASFSVLNDRVLEFAENKLNKIVGVNDTTEAAIRNALITGIEHGDDIPTIANSIENVFEDAIGNRSIIIARTEVIGTSNWATWEAYRQSGVVSKKEWVSTLDSRTRIDHVGAGGQIVKLNEPFEVGGEYLMYPGDPAGSAKNVIQCRCTLIAVME